MSCKRNDDDDEPEGETRAVGLVLNVIDAPPQSSTPQIMYEYFTADQKGHEKYGSSNLDSKDGAYKQVLLMRPEEAEDISLENIKQIE